MTDIKRKVAKIFVQHLYLPFTSAIIMTWKNLYHQTIIIGGKEKQ